MWLPALEFGSASKTPTMMTAKSISLSSSIWGVIAVPSKFKIQHSGIVNRKAA
jgi:hypothetical protein